jgi:hypothetical protein
MKTPDLKPCPFCGLQPELQTDIRYPRPACVPKKAYEVVCRNPDCIIGNVDERYRLTKREIIELWNGRAEP